MMKPNLLSHIHILCKTIMMTLIIIMGLTITELSLSSQNEVFANHGQEVLLTLDSGHFLPLTSDKGNQVKVLKLHYLRPVNCKSDRKISYEIICYE
jgi:hypothetical protein